MLKLYLKHLYSVIDCILASKSQRFLIKRTLFDLNLNLLEVFVSSL